MSPGASSGSRSNFRWQLLTMTGLVVFLSGYWDSTELHKFTVIVRRLSGVCGRFAKGWQGFAGKGVRIYR